MDARKIIRKCRYCFTFEHHADDCPKRITPLPDYSGNKNVAASEQFALDQRDLRIAMIRGDGAFAVALREIFERRERAARFSVCIK